MRSDKTLSRHLLILLGYLGLALLLWWPLPLHLNTHVPGVPQWAFDEATFLWNIWHFKSAVLENFTSPLHSNQIYFPLGVDLVLYTFNFYHVLAALPLALATNIVLGSNITLLMSTALSGYGTWLLIRYLLRDKDPRLTTWAALVGGALFAFASNRSVYAALGHYDMVTTQWIPFYALALLRSLSPDLSAKARRHAALLAGVFFAFNGLAEMITALFLAIFTVIVLLAWPAKKGEKSLLLDSRRWLPSFAIVGATAFILWGAVLIPILVQFATADFSLKGWGEAIPLSTDLLGWFTPTVLHPLFGGDIVGELRRVQLRALEGGVGGFRDINTVFLGWVSLALATLGALTARRASRIWWWTAIVFGLFTLGPFLQINGDYQFNLDGIEASIPLPYSLLHYIPVIKANRAPNRNSVVLMMALAVLASYGVFWLMARWIARAETRGDAPEERPAMPMARATAALCAVLVIGEHLALPMPLSDLRVPAVYAQIAADPANVSVLQVPLGWRNSFGVFGSEETRLQFYQSAHGKPMLAGNASRAPDFKMDYFRRLPFFQALTDIEFGRTPSAETLAAAKAQASELMSLYNVGYVLLHPPIEGRYPYADTWEQTWDFVKQTVPLEEEPFWEQDGIEAYRLQLPALDDEFSLDLADGPSAAYRGKGWDDADTDTIYDTDALWATGDHSVLFAPLGEIAPDAEYSVLVRAHPFEYPGSLPQSASLTVNGVPMETVLALDSGWSELAWKVPGSNLTDGLNRLEIDWGHAASPRDVLGGSRAIGSTGVELPFDADLKAFADGGFMALFDDEGIQTDVSAGRRGVNVTTLDAESGRVLSMSGFDTTANEWESAALAEHIAQVEEGNIVLVASNGDATAHLTPQAVNALRAIGADVSMETLHGNYFAIVGVQGKQSGKAAQVVDPNEAYLSLSLDRDHRPLAAAVDTVTIRRESSAQP